MSRLTAPVDSKEGIAHLMEWAKAHRFVLNPYHRDVAKKYGVETEGVMFSDPIPLSTGGKHG